MAQDEKQKKTYAFFHPDLGIGGAERLIIDAAVGLQNLGHKVVIFTSHCDPSHCFDEARDGTLDVRVRSTCLIPPSIFSRFTILCSILRQFYLFFVTYVSREIASLQPDAFIVDQLSAGLPVLRFLYPGTRSLFYCHFPDLLLATGREGWLKRLYRVPFDKFEGWSMHWADGIVVNSQFTKSIVGKTWPKLGMDKIGVVYPCVGTHANRRLNDSWSKTEMAETENDVVPLWKSKKVLLSINRFERKKGVELAIKAYAGLSTASRQGVRLVIAGGYDTRARENVNYHSELVTLAESLKLSTATTKTIVSALNVPDDIDVLFLLSVPSTLKNLLLRTARLLLYTPVNEHFGVVPLEAMLAGCPVLASNTGGPLETIEDGKCGWLRDVKDTSAWIEVMDRVLNRTSDEEWKAMGRYGKAKTEKQFSHQKMQQALDDVLEDLQAKQRRSALALMVIMGTLYLGVLDVAYLGMSLSGYIGQGMQRAMPPFAMSVMASTAWATYLVLCMGSQR